MTGVVTKSDMSFSTGIYAGMLLSYWLVGWLVNGWLVGWLVNGWLVVWLMVGLFIGNYVWLVEGHCRRIVGAV